jgi:uncharacterized RDD family membrane protein YckC
MTHHSVASLDRRFYAFVLDRLISWTAVASACWAAYHLFWSEDRLWPGVVLVPGAVLLVWAGFAVALGTSGSTPGKAAAGLRAVQDDTGTPIGVSPALLRGLVVGLATLPTLGIGVAALAWTALMDPTHRRRGWHDRVSGSVVVDVRPAPEPAAEVDGGLRHVVNLTAMRLVPASPPATEPAIRRAPVMTPSVASGPPPGWVVLFDSGERVPVDGLVLVGRRPVGRPGEVVGHLVALPSQDMSVSKTHAQVAVAGDGALVVMDRGSTNGSVLVRQGVSRPLSSGRPATLLDGDVVRFGDRSMQVRHEC